MNDANANGVFEGVGNIQDNFNPDGTAFVATGSAKSSSLPVTQFESTNPSAALQSVNAKVLPSLADGCPSHYLVSSDNLGEVLGFDSCSSSSPSTYWTWDPTNGIQAVNIPSNGYSSVQLLGVNDNGQLLATLVTTSGSYHWGTFNPVAGSSSARRLHGTSLGPIRIRH